jgi:hypothetical protein
VRLVRGYDATLNFQVCTGTGDGNYRHTTDPIGRGWYEGFDYTKVRVNYMDFFDGPDETIPTVSGIVELDIDHIDGTGEVRSRLWQDMNHHKFPPTSRAVCSSTTGRVCSTACMTGTRRG